MTNELLSIQSHLKLAHAYWSDLLVAGDNVIDATCGKGNDTLALCKLVLDENGGNVYSFDIQKEALTAARELLETHLNEPFLSRVHLINSCHSSFNMIPNEILNQVKLIVYNLGYLPGGDKTKTTLEKSTLESVQAACRLVACGGLISITCYPGHPAGAIEEKALLELAETLPRREWNCIHHRWINRKAAPSLLLLQKTS